MGKKRHARGSNNAQDRKRRKEAEEKWRSVRGDEQQNHRPNVWNTEPFENKRFEAFYNAQYFLNDEEDSKAFIRSLTSTLPTCFRLYTDSPFIDELRQELVQFIEQYHQQKQQQPVAGEEAKTTAENEEEKLPLEQISWYPNGSGYKLSLDKRSIRKRPELADLHKWMVLHTENGNITRQEAVSMVPPVALDVKPHHKCLDLCAAPGSKTSQLLEVINRSLTKPAEEQGIVVANDADTDRAYMLVHQCRRINSPLLVVTTHQGQSFPTIASDPAAFMEKRGSKVNMEFFDRVLCDVPCSGDGTLRKNPTIWSKWNTSMGAVMHPLQLMISRRGLQLTKKGGLMVYSTCSLSPYENESVVAELLRSNKGKLELVDAREFLPLFKARKGLSKWNVLDDHFAARKESQAKREAKQKQQQLKQQQQSEVKEEGSSEPMAVEASNPEGSDEVNATEVVENSANSDEKAVEDFSHIEDPSLRKCLEMGMLHFPTFEDVPNGVKWKYRQSLFPPTEEEAEWMHLERCLRCVPHDEDTGGFFVATLRKIDDSATSSTSSIAQKEDEAVAAPAAEAVVSEEEAKATAEAVALANTLDQGEGGGKGNQRGGRDNKKQRADNAMVKYHLWDEVSFQQMKEYYKFDDTITEKSFYVREDTALTRGKAAPTTAKTVYYFPSTVQSLLHGDVTQQLKIVTSGVKAFEKKAVSAAAAAAAAAEGNNGSNVTKDYRLLQECLPFLNRNIHARKVDVTIQDFSNLLEGGLVSYSTLSPQTLQQLTALSSGIVICTYRYKPSDVVSATEVAVKEGDLDFSMVCWKGSSACLNVMCSKIDLQSFKHQLNALRVLRSKIVAIKKFAGASTSAEVKEGEAEGEDDFGGFEEAVEEVENKEEDDDDDEGEEEENLGEDN